MGTRHHQVVINKEGQTKIMQYGQWDAYPSGQGVSILEYLRSGDLEKYQSELNKIEQITDEQVKEVESNENWTKEYPYLSRDCGSDIHKMIEEGSVRFVSWCDTEVANKWCEGFYTIDFKEGTFTSEYYGKTKSYRLDNLPTEEQYLLDMKDEEE